MPTDFAANSRRYRKRNYALRTRAPNGRWVAQVADEDHGKTGTYTNYGCRCDACRQAMAATQAQARQNRAERGRDE